MKSIKLKSGRERSLKRMHPWIFSGAIDQVKGSCSAGDTVEVISADGQWMARASYSPNSQISGRIWTFEEGEQVDAAFFRKRLENAVTKRISLENREDLTVYRVCNAESDGLPGVIVDRYGNWLVLQLLSAGAEKWRDVILSALTELYPEINILERSDPDVREKEGLQPRVEVIKGTLPESGLEVSEGGARFLVDLQRGHKTGFYIDQRENRKLFMDYCQGKEVLNCFSYTGAFGVYALMGGAGHVTNIETSTEAMELAARNFQLNGFDPPAYTLETADVFTSLRKYRDRASQFDVIVMDPPKFAGSASQLKGGTRGYKDINLLAFKLLRPGGVLFTFSCSGLVGPELFRKIIADAALDADRGAVILHHLYQAADHPVSLNFPEGLYLKGLAVKVEA